VTLFIAGYLTALVSVAVMLIVGARLKKAREEQTREVLDELTKYTAADGSSCFHFWPEPGKGCAKCGAAWPVPGELYQPPTL